MKRDFSQTILDLQDKPLVDGMSFEALQRACKRLSQDAAKELTERLAEESARPLTLGAAVASALIAPNDDDAKSELDVKVKRMHLALKIVNGGEVEITPDERDLMKRMVNKRYGGALVPARCADLLEGEAGA